LPNIGPGGVRELHLASPVNEGLLVKRLDDYIFTIVLNKETVIVKGPPPGAEPKEGEKVSIKVHIKGLHTGKKSFRTTDKKRIAWAAIANRVFDGVSCQGAGSSGAAILHGRYSTTVECVPTKPGILNLHIPTEQGTLVFERVAEIEKDETLVKEPPRREPFVGLWYGEFRWRPVRWRKNDPYRGCVSGRMAVPYRAGEWLPWREMELRVRRRGPNQLGIAMFLSWTLTKNRGWQPQRIPANRFPAKGALYQLKGDTAVNSYRGAHQTVYKIRFDGDRAFGKITWRKTFSDGSSCAEEMEMRLKRTE
jgi:hypothetical protein